MPTVGKTQRKRRTTMMDVASHAGVSQATVSLVLNGSPGAKLSDETRELVRQAAKDLQYELPRRKKADQQTGALAIGFIADEIVTDPWMALAFEGARSKAMEFGYNVFLATSNGNPEAEAEIVKNFEALPLAGLIYGTILTGAVKPIPELRKHKTVLLNCYEQSHQMYSVVPGDLLGGRTATQHLIDAGRKRIAFINGQPGIDATHDRLRGYRQALTSNDIPYDLELVRSGNWEQSSGYEQTNCLLDLNNPPDAIFCANDIMALGCLEALRERGISIPDEISVVGFDDRNVAKNTRPPLTTLELPHFEMGSIAVECLIELTGAHNLRSTQIKVECPLIQRSSVAPLKEN